MDSLIFKGKDSSEAAAAAPSPPPPPPPPTPTPTPTPEGVKDIPPARGGEDAILGVRVVDEDNLTPEYKLGAALNQVKLENINISLTLNPIKEGNIKKKIESMAAKPPLSSKLLRRGNNNQVIK